MSAMLLIPVAESAQAVVSEEVVADEAADNPPTPDQTLQTELQEQIAESAENSDAWLGLQGQLFSVDAYMRHHCGDMSYRDDMMTQRRALTGEGEWDSFSAGYRKGWNALKIAFIKAQTEPVCESED